MKAPKCALVVWQDHHSSNDTVTRETAEALAPLTRYAMGWVMADTKKGVTLAMDWGPDTPDEGDPHLFIGRAMILRVVEIPLPDPVDATLTNPRQRRAIPRQ
jgi:hypothetical protein